MKMHYVLLKRITELEYLCSSSLKSLFFEFKFASLGASKENGKEPMLCSLTLFVSETMLHETHPFTYIKTYNNATQQ